MARTSKANTAANVAVADETVAATTVAAEENMNDVPMDKQEVSNAKTTKAKVAELTKEDEIEVVSLIPNVSYKEKATGDIYKWVEVGQIEVMTFETLQNMWRESKGYFKNMWLKPLDERVIKKFALGNTYDKYEFLMDGENYTKENIDKICNCIKSTPSSLKLSLCNKVKSLVSNGDVSDISVIRAIEKSLNIDLIDLVG